MLSWLIAHEGAVGGWCLLGAAGFAAGIESGQPRRALALPPGRRWFRSLGLTALGSALVALCLPLTSIGAAAFGQAHGWVGLSALPLPLATVAGILCLDLAAYGQHRLSHGWPALWRVHQVHHSDIDVDWSTALRHHPLEMLIGRAVEAAVVIGCGIGPAAIIIYSAATTLVTVFSHANIVVPPCVEAVLRRCVVTPDLHRIHHSANVAESNHNYASVLPCWDRLLGTYRAEPLLGHGAMRLGLAGAGGGRERTLYALLCLPLERAGAPRFFRKGLAGGPTPLPRDAIEEHP